MPLQAFFGVRTRSVSTLALFVLPVPHLSLEEQHLAPVHNSILYGFDEAKAASCVFEGAPTQANVEDCGEALLDKSSRENPSRISFERYIRVIAPKANYWISRTLSRGGRSQAPVGSIAAICCLCASSSSA